MGTPSDNEARSLPEPLESAVVYGADNQGDSFGNIQFRYVRDFETLNHNMAEHSIRPRVVRAD